MLENEAQGPPKMRPKWAPGASRRASWRTLGAQGLAWGPFGAVLAALGRLLGRSWRLLGPTWGRLGASWAALGTSWGSFWPPGELFLELFGSLFFNALGKKRKPRFLLTVHHFLRFFELPGGKKTSKKPFRLVNYEVLVGENVKSFGLAAF